MPNRVLLDQYLLQEKLAGVVLRGEGHNPRLGVTPAANFAQRIELAIDPHRRFSVALS
jgi:hypothetical protein